MALIAIGLIALAFAIWLMLVDAESDQPPQPDPDPPAYFEPVEQMRQAKARAMRREALFAADHPGRHRLGIEDGWSEPRYYGGTRLGVQHKPSTHDIEINAPATQERPGA
jgi:hypothetical protein